MSFKEDDYEILMYFNFYILLVDSVTTNFEDFGHFFLHAIGKICYSLVKIYLHLY